MKIEETMQEFYKNKINSVDVPPCPAYTAKTQKLTASKHSRLLNIGLAAIIALAFIPLGYSAFKPSVLALRAAEACRTYELNTRISKVIMDLNISVSNSISQGGIK